MSAEAKRWIKMSVLAENGVVPNVSRSVIASHRPSVRVWAMWQAVANRYLNRTRAMVLALLLLALAAWGDFVTTAQATFTLFYVIPLAIAVWYVGIRAGYLIATLSVIVGAVADVVGGPRPSNWYLLEWNELVNAGLLISFAHTLAALRARVNLESQLRIEALDQLRHAERLNTVGKLASGIAHELGTPLNVISGHAELLVLGRIDAQEVKRSGQILLDQSERMTSILHQLLDFARRGAARVALTDMSDLTDSAAKLLMPLAGKSKIEIVRRGKPVNARVNHSEIQQVLTNLITNAIHAMPDGGQIDIDIRTERAHPPEADHGNPRDYVVLSVRDFGTGIPPDVLPKIFDPFFTTKDVGRGTGLGLSVAFGIVRDHGGWIAVNTRLGQGSTFSVYLPQVPPES